MSLLTGGLFASSPHVILVQHLCGVLSRDVLSCICFGFSWPGCHSTLNCLLSTLSFLSKYFIFIDRDLCCFIVVFTVLHVAKLSQIIRVGSCGCLILVVPV